MHVGALCCVAVGTGVIVVTAMLALVTRGRFFVRLHLVTPVTSLAGPLIGLGLVLENGLGFTAAQIAVIVLALAVASPAMQAATARLGAIEAGSAAPEPAE
ncbi:monovalent cation/H(+) antiporter subunit G [Pseudofrankia inefficax]|uniref:Na+/H+ antiporter subunit n=1 Tax=Pseudofrankia inefficax (strain DSM 45817 / CECT 9037 / DDB 130130 / EuI1c) TaxID=298654 RepID=E3J8G6_PSEI1|nr:monovalent cation/H(+) antiporter subunit G [Pseudofrankia inefficax]ADP84500.1 Na+/H+ antiporter subunit [Pseudofrankia inefficax]